MNTTGGAHGQGAVLAIPLVSALCLVCAVPGRADDGDKEAGLDRSTMSKLANPARIVGLTVSNTKTGRVMRLTLRSEIENWEKKYTLTEAKRKGVFTDAPDTLAIRPIRWRQGERHMPMQLVAMVIGYRGFHCLYEHPRGSGKYASRHVELTVKLKEGPDPGKIDRITASLKENISDRKEAAATLVETGPNTNKFQNEEGTFIVQLIRISNRGKKQRNSLTAMVRSERMGVQRHRIDAAETAYGSRDFRTDQLHSWKYSIQKKKPGDQQPESR